MLKGLIVLKAVFRKGKAHLHTGGRATPRKGLDLLLSRLLSR